MRKKAKLKRHTIEVDGYNIVYLESTHDNNAQTLMLVHGFNEEKDAWLLLADALKEKYHLIIIDQLGSGESDLPMDFDYSLRNQANFLQKVIEKLTLEKDISSYHLAGQSQGGGLAILLADKLPIDKLILIDNMGVHVERSQIQLDSLGKKIEDLPFLNLTDRAQFKALMQDAFYKPPYIPNFMLDHFVAKQNDRLALVKKKFRAIATDDMFHADDLTEEVKNIKQKTLIVWGREDKGIHVASAYKQKELIVNSKLIVYDNCGHSVHSENPKELAKDISTFLN